MEAQTLKDGLPEGGIPLIVCQVHPKLIGRGAGLRPRLEVAQP